MTVQEGCATLEGTIQLNHFNYEELKESAYPSKHSPSLPYPPEKRVNIVQGHSRNADISNVRLLAPGLSDAEIACLTLTSEEKTISVVLQSSCSSGSEEVNLAAAISIPVVYAEHHTVSQQYSVLLLLILADSHWWQLLPLPSTSQN